MHTLVLCLWVLGIVSAADDESERPVYIIPQNGAPPGYSNGQPFFGAPVSSNNVKVLPNAYKTSHGFVQPGSSGSSTSVPVIVDRNTPFQGNTNQPIPVPVAYPDDGSALAGQSQQTLGTSPLPIQRPPYPGVTPIPVLVKAPAAAYRPIGSTPRPFQVRNPQFTHETSSENPYSGISSSFRLWPKLPEPIPVPVLTAEAFVRNSYRNLNTNLAPQYPQNLPVNAYTSSQNSYQQNLIPVRFPDNTQSQNQPGQPANQGPIYIIVAGGNNNAQSGSYQAPSQTQGSYQSQTPQLGNQRFIILAPPRASSQPNQAYRNDGYSSNQYENQLQGQSGQQSPFNYAVFGSSNAPGSQSQAQSSQQAPLNYAILAPTNGLNSQSQDQAVYQQTSLKYAIFGPTSAANSAGQAPQNYAVLAPAQGSQSSNNAGQSPLTYAVLGSSNDGSSFSSSIPSSSQYFGYSSTQPPSPQNVGFSSTQSPTPQYVGLSSTQSPTPQYVGYSSTQTPTPQYVGLSSTQSPTPQYVGLSSTQSLTPQYVGYPSTLSAPQYSGYSSSTQSPQYVGYSTTPSPSQSSYSQSAPVSRVSFSGAGSNYSYSIK